MNSRQFSSIFFPPLFNNDYKDWGINKIKNLKTSPGFSYILDFICNNPVNPSIEKILFKHWFGYYQRLKLTFQWNYAIIMLRQK